MIFNVYYKYYYFIRDWNKRPSAKKLLTHKFIMDEDDANSIDDNNEDSS